MAPLGDALPAQQRDNMVLLSGTANRPLADSIAEHIGIQVGSTTVKQFADGELFMQVDSTVRGRDVFLVQPTSPPVNDHLMELLLTISTLRRASAGSITALIPYYGYARQDRKLHSRTPISAADVAVLLESMGVDRVMAVDLHSGQIQGFFSPKVPMDNLPTHTVAVDAFLRVLARCEAEEPERFPADLTISVVSPDAGGVYRAMQFQKDLASKMEAAGSSRRVQLATMLKHRPRPNEVGRVELVGEVVDTLAIIIDDMSDTSGTLCAAAKSLMVVGSARMVMCFITHAVFSGPAYERLNNSVLEKIIVTDTIRTDPERVAQFPELGKKLEVVPLGGMLATAIIAVQGCMSLHEVIKGT